MADDGTVFFLAVIADQDHFTFYHIEIDTDTQHNTITQAIINKKAKSSCKTATNPFKLNGFFHSYYLEKSILHFRGVRLIFSSLA